jgi:hypothetical protein
MKDARETIPAEERKHWDENVAKDLHIYLRTDIECTALGENQFYLGKKDGKKFCIIERSEGVFRGSSTKRGHPHYFIETIDPDVWELCWKRFQDYYKKELEVTKEEKAQKLGLELKQ